MELSAELLDRCAGIRLLALDVDGVLTDGRLYYGPEGEQLKTFDVRDGLGIKLLRDAGIEVATVSARGSAALDARMRDLSISHALSRCDDKWTALGRLLDSLGVSARQCAFVGDDIIDLPVLRAVGLAVAVADAHPLVRAEVHAVTVARGGRGAVREVCDAILESQGGLGSHVASYLAARGRKGAQT